MFRLSRRALVPVAVLALVASVSLGATQNGSGDVVHQASTVSVRCRVTRPKVEPVLPGTLPPEGGTNVHVFEHARPHAIVVDQSGERFTNEGTSYVQIGLNFYERNKTVPTIPAWTILDSRHRARYAYSAALPKKTPKAWLDSGFMKKADTIEDLARLCNLPADKLKATIEQLREQVQNVE